MKKQPKQQQHGDVCIEAVDRLPEGCTRLKPQKGRWVVMEGEHTGHTHAIETIEGCALYEKDGVIYMEIQKPVGITHEEHHAQPITPGYKKAWPVIEYDYLTQMTKPVVD